MVRIRLRRTGLKGQAITGLLLPIKKRPAMAVLSKSWDSTIRAQNLSRWIIKEERVYDWMQKGAQPSESVVKLFNSIGLSARFAR
jgi:small subunit ribosomal protein S16